MIASARVPIEVHPPLFGERRALACPPPVRARFVAGDGAILQVHHIAGGDKGPLILAPGTAMTALSYLADTTQESFAEFLADQGFDVWLFDWRTSPLLDSHHEAYTFDDVARCDWPAVIDYVLGETGRPSASVLAHCLSAPCLLLSLVRGYLPSTRIKALVASQAGLHLVLNRATRIKIGLRVDQLLPGNAMVHQSSDGPRRGAWDLVVGLVGAIWPKSYSCTNAACHRQSATFGDIVSHDRINDTTHELMGAHVPEVNSTFVKDAADLGRKSCILTAEDRGHLERLAVPLLLVSGAQNQMLLPEGTRRTYELLRQVHGDLIEREVFPGFGHLDCYLGTGAREVVWERLARFLDA